MIKRGYSMSEYGYLMHHGVKGQKWGVRRYQNSDGSLTDAGKRRYGINLFEKNPQHWYKTGYGISKQYKLYKDVRKAHKKENKGISNEDLDKLISKEYKRIYKKDAGLEYNLGKTSYEHVRGSRKYGVGGALGASISLIEAKAKGKEHPYSAHVRYTNEILRKNGYKGFK